MKRQWLWVVGYENLYEVSDYGDVRSYHRNRLCILKPYIHNDRYHYVQLSKDGVPKWFQVHRLVLEAFVGLCPSGKECRHLDGNGLNNKRRNLKWGTMSENQRDRISQGNSNRGDR